MYQRMMNDILKQIKAGEVSGVQFKERILDKYDIACELVAFSNSHGGKLVVDIKDKTGETNATFMNNDKAQEFVIMVWREESNQVGNEVHGKSNQVEDLDTRLRHSDTNLDTGLRHSDTNLDTGLRHSGTDHDTFAEDHDTFCCSRIFADDQPGKSYGKQCVISPCHTLIYFLP